MRLLPRRTRSKGLRTLRRLGGGLWLLRHLLRELQGIRRAMTRLADAQAPLPQGDQAAGVAITYVSDAQQAEFMEIELRLTQATGQPPTEEEVLLEWERRHPQVQEAAE